MRKTVGALALALLVPIGSIWAAPAASAGNVCPAGGLTLLGIPLGYGICLAQSALAATEAVVQDCTSHSPDCPVHIPKVTDPTNEIHVGG